MKGLVEDPSHRRLIATRPELRVCVQYISVAVCFPSLSLPGTAVMENKHISTWHSELLNCPPFISPSSLFPFIPLPAVYLFGSFSGPLTPGPITYPGATTPTPGSPYTLPRGSRTPGANTLIHNLGPSGEGAARSGRSRRGRADGRCFAPVISSCLLWIYVFVCAASLNVVTSVMSSIFPAVTSNSSLPSLCLPVATSLLYLPVHQRLQGRVFFQSRYNYRRMC